MPNPTAHPAAQEAPEERTRREIAELPVPVPGETWHHCDGEPVEILDVRHDGHDHIMAYRWMQDGRVETRTLRSWYGFERPGVRRFQRERPASRPTLGEVLTEVIEWGEQTFRVIDPAALARHLAREAAELAERPDSEEEIADVLILLCQIAFHQGIELPTAVARKLAILRTREWGEPDAEGVIEHVREEGALSP